MSHEVNILLNKLPAYKGNQRLVNKRQDTFDIIREILAKHRKTIGDYNKIAKMFWTGDTAGTAEKLYYFLKKNVPYRVEPTLQQTVKTPAAILEERYDFGNDCKHYASFSIGVGEALRRMGLPVKCFYRFASYNAKRKNPGHVFAVFVDKGKEIWVDPVPEIGGFNRRYVTPVYKIDKMPPMSKNGDHIGSLYDISGIGDYALPTTQYVSGYGATHLLAGMSPTEMVGRIKFKKMSPWMRKAFNSPLNPLHPGVYTPGLAEKMSGGSHWLDQARTSDNPGLPGMGAGHGGHHRHRGYRGSRGPRFYPGYSAAPVIVEQPVVYQDPLPVEEEEIGRAKKKEKKKGKGLFKGKLKLKVKPGKLFAKYGLATSRNAYLLLLKLNVFSMATKIWTKAAKDRNSAAWKQLVNKWKQLGGKEDALYKNVKLGVNTYNKLHKKHKITGTYDINGADDMPDVIHGVEDMGYPDDIGYYHDGMSVGEILLFVHDNHHHHRRRRGAIGAAHVAVAAGVIAAATPIIKALAGLLKSFGINTNKADAAGDADTEALAESHNETGNTDSAGVTTAPDGTKTQVTTNPDGSQTMEVKNIPGITPGNDGGGSSSPAAAPAADDDDDVETKTKTITKTKTWKGEHSGGFGFQDMMSNVMSFVSEHKMWFIGGGLAIAAVVILPKIFSRPKRRR